MIIGFSKYGAGNSDAALGYLTGYLLNGEERNPRPEVVRGDPRAVSAVIDALPFKRKYSSGVLSFAAEDRVTPEIQEDIMDRFERAVFAGIPPDRRSIVWVKHGDKGRPELHFVCARVDLGTGKSLNIAPPTPASRTLLDTLRSGINLRYGFRDPGDPACKQAVSVPAHVAKLAAQSRRLGRSPKSDIRHTITDRLLEQAEAGAVASRADVVNALRADGFEISREGINHLTVVCPTSRQRVRLKGEIYRRNFRPENLTPRPPTQDPARLLTLDRTLERMVEKRAAYHRARYDLTEPQLALTEERMDYALDRTRTTIAPNRPATGERATSTGAPVRNDAFRLNEAAQHVGNASVELESAARRFVQAHSSFTQDFDAVAAEASRTRGSNDLVRRYAPPPSQRNLTRDFSLELEL